MKQTFRSTLLKTSFPVFLLLGFARFSFAQNLEARGILLDNQTKLPVEHATILLLSKEKNLLTTSDADGKFAFSVSGKSRIVVHHISYVSDTFELVAGTETTFNLQPTAEKMEEVIISSVRASDENPSTSTNISKAQIEKVNFGRDMPMLLNSTPSTVVNSDAGAGVGYTGIRIRGIDPTRINVTINGVPLNDAESHGTYWVDLPDFASSASSIQIQRGAGTSTNGTASFGASVNVKTDHIEAQPYMKADLGYGSFNTRRIRIQNSTGIMKNGWGMQSRLSVIRSDGFIDRASSDLRSMFFTAAHYGKKDLLKFNVMLGHERTYQAWYGVPQPKYQQNQTALNSFMDELYLSDEERQHLQSSNYNTYNPYTYKNEVDNYDQHHFQMFYNRDFKRGITLTTGLHFTHGFGYYEQYKQNDDFSTYGLKELIVGGDTINSGDFIRRLWLNNNFYGLIYSLQIPLNRTHLVIGGGINNYDGKHYGEIIWAQFASDGFYGDHYYDYKARKTDGNMYAKFNRRIGKRTHLYADVQVRAIDYSYDLPGRDEPGAAHFVFVNPKAGIVKNWAKDNTFTLMLAASNREPVRDDLQAASLDYTPQPEHMYNLETGNTWKGKNWQLECNGYMMYYNNQLVLTGKINNVGAYVRTNVPKSYRTGIETQFGYRPVEKLTLQANLTLSQNKIIAFTEYVDDWYNGGQVAFERKNTDLAFSPNAIGYAAAIWQYVKDGTATLSVKTVSKQYLDNSQSNDRKLDGFTVLNFQLNHNFKIHKTQDLQIGIQVNNILNVEYAPNGYTFGTMNGEQRQSFNYVYPMAGTNYLLRVLLTI
ncbi:MAG: TonB-dependent receptor plug domain-containing protein [Bacteroidetes bacterium]|nr:TonB-dependent receptor plug domain-containing protein [Bacteroidota bacterium]